jgi:acetyl esterase/lipase
MKKLKKFIILLLSLTASLNLSAQNDVNSAKDIVYATTDGKNLDLDIYTSKSQKNQPLIVWIHGGAWQTGNKDNPPLGLMPYGYALASVNFRSSTEAKFPAQIHEIKAAIRFLRANAGKYGYNGDKIIIWGSSSGGHLAALVTTTNNNTELEGKLGNHLQTTSTVQGGIDYYGPTNFLTILTQSTPHGLNVRLPALALLLGNTVENAKSLATLASPVHQVSENDPALFIVHGEQDIQVPINQSIELWTAYKAKNLKTQIEFIPDAGHSSPAYMKKELLDKIDDFLKKNL